MPGAWGCCPAPQQVTANQSTLILGGACAALGSECSWLDSLHHNHSEQPAQPAVGVGVGEAQETAELRFNFAGRTFSSEVVDAAPPALQALAICNTFSIPFQYAPVGRVCVRVSVCVDVLCVGRVVC